MAIFVQTTNTPAGDYEKLTVSSSSVGFTAAKILINQAGGTHKRAAKALVSVETQSIRVKYAGTPTSSDGHLHAAGDFFFVDGEGNIANFRMIAATTDATVHVTYFYNI